MYNFIFWFFYKYFEWKDKTPSAFVAASMVMFTLIIHLMLLYSILRYFTGLNVGVFSDNYVINKLCLLPFALTFMALTYLIYYRKRSAGIVAKYDDNNMEPFTFKNIALVLLIIVVPLIIMVKFTNLAVRRYHF